MAKAGFKRNAKTIAKILHNDPGGQAAVRAAQQRVFDALPEDVKAEAFMVEYHTDRFVGGVVVPADSQAKDGAATRAAGQAGLTPG